MESIRSDIEEIDTKLLELLKERFEKAILIANYKKNNNLPIYDKNREKILIEKLQSKNMINALYVDRLWNEIFSISRNIQENTNKSENNLGDYNKKSQSIIKLVRRQSLNNY
jgi:chorismate mutase/prephenate dehydratase